MLKIADFYQHIIFVLCNSENNLLFVVYLFYGCSISFKEYPRFVEKNDLNVNMKNSLKYAIENFGCLPGFKIVYLKLVLSTDCII